MLAALSNAFKIPDLRRKIFYTLALLLVFRVGTHVPVPGVDARALAEGLNIEEAEFSAF